MSAISNFIDLRGLSYCGKEAQDIFAKDIYDIDLRQYGITFMDGVKGKMKMYTGEIGDVWQLYTCPFSPAGEASLAESYIEPVAIKVNQENCYDVFWNTFLVDQTEISLRGGIPQTFADWYFAKLRKKMSAEYQEIFWKGDADYSGSTKPYIAATDGVEKIIAESEAEAVDPADLSVDNVIAQVEAVVMAGIAKAGEAEVDTEGYKIFMNHNDVRLLEVALGKECCPNSSQAVFANYARENGRIFVMGFEVVPTMQSRNFILFGPARNLVLGYDTFDSHLEYKLIDMRETTGDNAFRVLAISNIAVGVILPELFAYSVGTGL